MMYQGRMYYDEYRITPDGLQICNSSNRLIKEKCVGKDNESF
jgi:hypothetical protein